MLVRLISFLKRHKLLFTIVSIALIIIVLLFRRGTNATAVNTYTVNKQEIIREVTASGKTTPKDAYVVRAGAAAKIEKLNFSSGDRVNEGDLVLQLDQKSLLAGANSAWQAYLEAQASVESFDDQIKAAQASVSSRKLVRDKEWREYMADNGQEKKEAYKAAEAAYQAAEAELQSLNSRKSALNQGVTAAYLSYSAARSNLTDVVLKAPSSGILVLENVAEGQSVLAGQVLFSITNFTGTEFTAEIDETDFQQIKPGQFATVTLDGYSGEFKGEVIRLDGKTVVTSSGSTVIPAAIRFLNGPEVNPILNMNGTATIEVGKELDSLAVPFDAILYDTENKTYVFIVKDNKVEKREVELGFEGTEFVTVTRGIVEGEVVVVGEEITRLTDGANVSVNKN